MKSDDADPTPRGKFSHFDFISMGRLDDAPDWHKDAIYVQILYESPTTKVTRRGQSSKYDAWKVIVYPKAVLVAYK